MFELFDKDRSGCISARELSTVLKCVGQDPEEEEIRQIIDSLDFNGKMQNFKLKVLKTIKFCFYIVLH